MNKPNIVLMISHDMGRRLGCYGEKNVPSKNIDQIASKGLVFTNYFATAPLCSPSRGSIYTGTYPHMNGLMGLVNRGWSLPKDSVTVQKKLRENGYDVILFGLQHETVDPLDMGYSKHLAPDEPNKAEKVAVAFQEFIEDRETNKIGTPFFAVIGTTEAHRPFSNKEYEPNVIDKTYVPGYLPNDKIVKKELSEFDGLIRAFDEAANKINGAIENSIFKKNTLFIITTDHGIPFPGAKSTLYDSGIGTFLIMKGSIITNGGRYIDSLLSNIDLMPTLLDLCGVSIPKTVTGKSFVSLIFDKKYDGDDVIFAEKTWHDDYDPKRCVRTTNYKYIRNFKRVPLLLLPQDISESQSAKSEEVKVKIQQIAPQEELYDVVHDPYEKDNLVSESKYADILNELRVKLSEFMKRTNDPILSGDVKEPNE